MMQQTEPLTQNWTEIKTEEEPKSRWREYVESQVRRMRSEEQRRSFVIQSRAPTLTFFFGAHSDRDWGKFQVWTRSQRREYGTNLHVMFTHTICWSRLCSFVHKSSAPENHTNLMLEKLSGVRFSSFFVSHIRLFVGSGSGPDKQQTGHIQAPDESKWK